MSSASWKVTFLALGLLLAPKVGRTVTAVVIVTMAGCLMQPIWKLRLVQGSTNPRGRWAKFVCVMIIALLTVSAFGAYVWPPIRRHALSAEERTSFEAPLKAEKGGDENLEVQIACSSGDEKACIYAGQLISLLGEAGWQIHPSVDRLALARASEGVTVLRRAGNMEDMQKHWNSSGYVK